MGDVRLVFDGAKMEELLRGRDGPVNRYLMGRAEIVKRAAVMQCNKRTGKLSKSIVKRSEYVGTELGIRIKAAQPYSVYVHEGTKPHVIKAKNKPYLVFFWANGPTGAHVYRMKQVNHPGYAGNRFLTDNLHLFYTGRYVGTPRMEA